MLSIEETNELITYASEKFDKLFAKRFLVESALFPVSEYILVACVNSYVKFYDQLIKLTEKITVDEIIEREKGKLFTEITPLHIFNIQMFPLFGRMCRISNKYRDDPMKESEEKFDEIRYIMTFWKDLASKYYGGPLTVDEMNGQCQIASEESLDLIKNKLKEPTDVKELTEIKRMVANVEQIAFMDECETRMKISNHGPYFTGEDEFITIKEITRLYNGSKGQWPWSETNSTAPYSNLLIAYQLKGQIKCKYNDWGTMIPEPVEYKDFIKSYCLLAKKGNKIIELGKQDIEDFNKYSKDAHKELYLKYTSWTKKEKIEAGVLV
ncbi:MAG: hypothetical protein ACTSRP_20310, partial [Candidatus Helarchaeota archaeon]